MTGDTTNQIQPIIDRAMNTVPILQTGRCRRPKGKIVLVSVVFPSLFEGLTETRYVMIATLSLLISWKMFFKVDCF